MVFSFISTSIKSDNVNVSLADPHEWNLAYRSNSDQLKFMQRYSGIIFVSSYSKNSFTEVTRIISSVLLSALQNTCSLCVVCTKEICRGFTILYPDSSFLLTLDETSENSFLTLMFLTFLYLFPVFLSSILLIYSPKDLIGYFF